MKNKLPLVGKAYFVGHKDEYYNRYSPETSNTVICVELNESVSIVKRKFLREKHFEFDDLKFIDIRAKRKPESDLFLFEGEKKSINQIYNITEYRDWRSRMEKMVAEHKGQKVYIRSGQWNAYWCANGAGYTTKISDVGVYDIEDAWRRVSHVGLEKRISFELLSETIEKNKAA
jgi:hypothetical protein